MASESTTTCASAVVGTLEAHGLNRIYCVPGIQNDWFFNALHDTEGRVAAIHTRHEQGAAYMALGAALATGSVQAFSVVPGPGLLNTAAALATAYSTNAPVLCLTGQIPSRAIGRGIGLLHEIPDQLGILERLTKKASRVTDPARAAAELAGAIAMVTDGRPQPVGLEIPPDILAARGDYAAAAPFPASPETEPDAGLIAEAAALIARAERPMIVVGGGAQEMGATVRQLAERLQAPVLAYRMGRGVLDDRHPLSITLPVGHRLWQSCDLVLAIGSRAQMPLSNWGSDAAMKLVRIEVDPSALDAIRAPDLALIGRVETILPRLADAIDRNAPKRPSRAEDIAALKQEIAAEADRLLPQVGFLRAIREAIGEDGILVDELTQCGYVSRFAYPVYRPRSFISSGYQGTLGWGYATGLGVQDARRDAAVVSISGDGGFMFNVQELATAVRHDIPLIAVVFNDGAYGNVRRMQRELYDNRVIATDLVNPDFVALGRSFGVDAERAATPEALRRAVAAAAERRRPALIEVPVGDLPSPWRFLDLPRLRGG